MLKVIEDEKQIARYARQFAGSFRPLADERIRVRLGHQGANFAAKVAWSRKLGLWTLARTTKGVRYWNTFGTGRPEENGHLAITAEVNFPWTGIDRTTGAAFAQDAWRRVYAVHRGKIGGGKKGVGKSLFEENYRGCWAWMEDGDTLAQVAVIGVLGGGRLALQVAQFVRKVEKLKSAALITPQTSLNFSEVAFREELVGKPPGPAGTSAGDCDHDLIVSQLANLLLRWKFIVGNDAATDLFVVRPDSRAITHLIAVSTGLREEETLAAAAGLLLRRAAEDVLPAAFLMLPEDQIARYAPRLRTIGIETLVCRLEGERIVFPDLGRIRMDPRAAF